MINGLMVKNVSSPLDSLRFKVYGQQCRRCDDDDFLDPRWYREEVEKVLKNVHQKIGEVRLTPSPGHANQGLDVVCDIMKVRAVLQ